MDALLSPRLRRRRPLGPANAAPLPSAAPTVKRPTGQGCELLAHAAVVSALVSAVRGGAWAVALSTLAGSGAGKPADIAVAAGRRALEKVAAPPSPHDDPDILSSPAALAVLLCLGGDLRATTTQWPDPPGPAEAEAAAAAAAALAQAVYPGLLPADAADPAAPLLDAAYSHGPGRARALCRCVESVLLAACRAAGPGGAPSYLAFGRAAGFGRLAAAARALAASDVAAAVAGDPAGLAALDRPGLEALLLTPGARAAPAAPPLPAFDAVAAWYEGDPAARADDVAGLLEGAVRLRRLRPHELEGISEAAVTNATPASTAAFAHAYLDVSYMGIVEGVKDEGEADGTATALAAADAAATAALTAVLAAGVVVQGGSLAAGGAVSPPRRRQRTDEAVAVVRPGSGGGALRRELF